MEVIPLPINNTNDDLEYDSDTDCIYHVKVSQGKLKMMFLVCQRPLYENHKREFETLKCVYISLHGIEERDRYLESVEDVSISADTSIVNEVFSWTLKPYGLRLLDVTFHNFEFFETSLEGKGFIFEDKEIYEKLKDIINTTCRRMLNNPKIKEY